MLLSIIVPAFNEEKLIQQTLQKIIFALEENQKPPFAYEIIVVDNNSTDRTAELAAEAGAIVVFEPHNQISKARNKGAEIAQGEWLLFIDADTYPQPGTIAALVQCMAQKDTVGCTSTIKVVDTPYWYKANLEGQNINMRLFKTCLGLFVMAQAAAFRAIGGFNTDLYAFEDIDFVNRLKRYGRSQEKRFVVLHRHPVTTSGRKGNLYGKGTMTLSVLTGLYYFLFKKKLNDASRLPFWYDGRR